MKIVVAVDKSEESQQALRYTCHLLEHFTAIVDALYVKPDVVDSTEGVGSTFCFTIPLAEGAAPRPPAPPSP